MSDDDAGVLGQDRSCVTLEPSSVGDEDQSEGLLSPGTRRKKNKESEEKALDAFGPKFYKEFERRLKLLQDTKPWTIANRIRLITTSRCERQAAINQLLDLLSPLF